MSLYRDYEKYFFRTWKVSSLFSVEKKNNSKKNRGYFRKLKNSKNEYYKCVQNRLASSKSRVMIERNFSATPISASFFFLSLLRLFSFSLSLSADCGYNANTPPTENEIERLRGQSRRDSTFGYIYEHLRIVPR